MLTHQAPDLDAVFAALAHPIRRALIQQLASGDHTVNELARPHEVSRPAISQHLRVLEEAGLVRQTRDGRVRRCSLQGTPLASAFSWIVQYRIFWEERLDNLVAHVDGENEDDDRSDD